jgi:hypothetical protein
MRSPCGAGPDNTISHGEQVMYGWGRDAPGMHLPAGAGFSVGPRTGIRMAVLQVGIEFHISWRLLSRLVTLPSKHICCAQPGATHPAGMLCSSRNRRAIKHHVAAW